MNNDKNSPDIDQLLRSMGMLKKQLDAEMRTLGSGEQAGPEIDQLMELLRSEGADLQALLEQRYMEMGSDESAADYDLGALATVSRCFICEEPVSAAHWQPEAEKIRCDMCRGD